MKKIFITLLLLLLVIFVTACNNISKITETTEANATVIWFVPQFRSVDELVYWVENAESFDDFEEWYQPVNWIRQNGSMLTVEEVSGVFLLPTASMHFTHPLSLHPNSFSINYNFRSEDGNDGISISIYLTGLDRANQSLEQAVENFRIRHDYINTSIESTTLDALQYAIFAYGIQGASAFSEKISLDKTNLYYLMFTYGPRVFFEIDGMHIEIRFSIRNPDSPLASIRDGWDNSYLDMFQFISRPIRVGGRPMEPITPPIGVPDVTLNGVSIEFDVDPIIVNDRTMVPFRAIFEALEMEVEWNSHAGIATGMRRGLRIEIPIGHDIAFVNGDEVDLDVPAMIYNDRTMVPLRFVAEATGANVEWDEDTQTVLISTN
ncbi:MAG: copper amine oxidase N-terminal domain-containing protein [Oscillospiraceae bacterium]|nr:copper amine oxidase N-terminal domain-containing protein [Oscillospiraceae bacterium]